MNDEVRDPLVAAVAIVRARLRVHRGEISTREALEVGLLEITTSDDPAAVIQAMGTVTAQALIAVTSGTSVTPEALLDGIETHLRGEST